MGEEWLIKRFQVTDRLVIELWPSKVVEPPLVRIMELGEHGNHVYVHLDEVRHLISALAAAAEELLTMEMLQAARKRMETKGG